MRHDLRYHDPFHTLMVTIHFMYGINGSNRMLVVTSEDHNTRAWVNVAQAMIKYLLELNHNPAVMRAIGDIGEEGTYNFLRYCTTT